jgi:3-oxo-5alpha-steroid 4-dehydrogenase
MTNTTVSDPAQIQWDVETDVVVAGFGGAGACAAIEAADSGARVIALDRFDGGGATSASGGVYYGGGTRFQRDAGFDDSAEEMFKYLSMELSDVVSPETLRRFCEQSNSNLEWLVDKGLRFDSRFSPAKTSYPGKGVFLYFSGNEQNPACAAVAKPAPRGHRVVGRSMTGGTFYACLERAARSRGVELWQHSPVVGLISDRAGRVVGVEVNRLRPGGPLRQHRRIYRLAKRLVGAVSPAAAERWSRRIADIESRNTERVRIRARRGVVLATGGYIFNRDLVAREAALYKDAAPLGTPGCDGSGILLARALGARTSRMDHVCASRSISPPEAFVSGVIVDAAGRRFINEDSYTGTLGRAVAEAPSGAAWLVLDRPSLRKALRNSLPGSGRLLVIHCLPALMLILFGSRKARSFAELAQRCGLPPAALERTLEDYNRTASAGAADEFGKKSKFCQPLSRPPYYALDISLRSRMAPLPTFSLGGLIPDEDTGGVKRSDGTVLQGLFCAGRAAVGLPSNRYISGLALADCVFSGRRAGRHAALESTPGVPPC